MWAQFFHIIWRYDVAQRDTFCAENEAGFEFKKHAAELVSWQAQSRRGRVLFGPVDIVVLTGTHNELIDELYKPSSGDFVVCSEHAEYKIECHACEKAKLEKVERDPEFLREYLFTTVSHEDDDQYPAGANVSFP